MPKIKTDKGTILVKALQLLRTNGYYHSSLSDLAKACGVEKAHFYYYFKDKQDLMKEVLIFTRQYIGKNIFDVAYLEDLPPKKRLIRIVNTISQYHPTSEYGCLMGNTVLETAGHEKEFEGLLRDYFDKWIQCLAFLYKTVYNEETAMEYAKYDFQCLQGSIMMMRLYQDRTYLEKVLEKIKNRIE
jgi:AcrR family transcriptional regulator